MYGYKSNITFIFLSPNPLPNILEAFIISMQDFSDISDNADKIFSALFCLIPSISNNSSLVIFIILYNVSYELSYNLVIIPSLIPLISNDFIKNIKVLISCSLCFPVSSRIISTLVLFQLYFTSGISGKLLSELLITSVICGITSPDL